MFSLCLQTFKPTLRRNDICIISISNTVIQYKKSPRVEEIVTSIRDERNSYRNNHNYMTAASRGSFSCVSHESQCLIGTKLQFNDRATCGNHYSNPNQYRRSIERDYKLHHICFLMFFHITLSAVLSFKSEHIL